MIEKIDYMEEKIRREEISPYGVKVINYWFDLKALVEERFAIDIDFKIGEVVGIKLKDLKKN